MKYRIFLVLYNESTLEPHDDIIDPLEVLCGSGHILWEVVSGSCNSPGMFNFILLTTWIVEGHFTHKTEGPWPLQFKSSHWSKGQRQSKITSHTGEGPKAQRRLHGWKVYKDEKPQGRFQDIQTPPSSSLKLIEFKTYYIKPNPTLFSANKICNGPATWSIFTAQCAWGSMTT